MQTFPLPDFKLKFYKSTLDLLVKDALLNSFPIHAIHLLIPGSEQLIGSCKETLTSTNSTYLIVRKITLVALIEETFINHFVKKGSLYAFSYGANVESENFLTIVPSGKIVISLEKEISESLALIKENSRNQKKKSRWSNQVYTIQMNAPDFLPGKKLYQSALFEVNKLKHIEFDLILRWKPAGNMCPESIRTYFERQGFECVSCQQYEKHYSNFTVPVPKMDFSVFDPTTAENMLEWIGTQICGIEYSGNSDSFISNFTVPEPSETLQKLQVGSFEGFYTGEHVCNLLQDVRKIFEVDPKLPFVAVSISGYQDCYIISKGYEKFSSNDKMICLIVSPVLDCWVVTHNTG